jgi:hypothetical protein
MLEPCDHQSSFYDSGIVSGSSHRRGGRSVCSRQMALEVATGSYPELFENNAGEQPRKLIAAFYDDRDGWQASPEDRGTEPRWFDQDGTLFALSMAGRLAPEKGL